MRAAHMSDGCLSRAMIETINNYRSDSFQAFDLRVDLQDVTFQLHFDTPND
jgi:hypothetical protein